MKKKKEKKIMVDRGISAETLMIEEILQVERNRFEKEQAIQTSICSHQDTCCQTERSIHVESSEMQTEGECVMLTKEKRVGPDSMKGSLLREDLILKLIEEDERETEYVQRQSEASAIIIQQDPKESFFQYVHLLLDLY